MGACVIAPGVPDKWGYGRVKAGGRTRRAHRLAWEQANGPIPAGLFVLHRCDNPPCINVEHLWLGTQAQNMKDRSLKGRWRGPAGDDHRWSKLAAEQVAEIRRRRLGGETQSVLAREFGVCRSNISAIATGRSWTR